MRKALFIILCCASVSATAQKATISGYVKDRENGENLIGANIYDAKTLKGTTANSYGFYSLTLESDSILLTFSFVGYQAQQISLYLENDTTVNIELESSNMLEEVVVTSESMEAVQESSQMSAVNLRMAPIKSLPALMGEVDVMKTLQLLPGVQSGSEGSSGLYVRGGGPDQNLILLDGVPVYNASHLFGFFSVFNPDAINNIQLIKGGFPARYGGRLSSVVDISMKEGNAKKFSGEGSVGLISSKLTLEGPIAADKTSFIVSGRRTYIDVLAYPLIKAASEGNGTAGYYFYDLNAKVNHRFSYNDRVYLSAYLGKDKAYANYKESYVSGPGEITRYNEQFGLRWGNITTALRWNRIISQKLFANAAFTYSDYKFDLYEEMEETRERIEGEDDSYFKAQYLSGIEDFALKLDFDFIPNPDHYVRFGVNGIRHAFKPGAFHFNSMDEDTTFGASNTYAAEVAAYLEDDFKLSQSIKINAGLHYSGFLVGERYYQSLQPRFSARWMLNRKLSFKASYAAMAQYIHLLTNSGIGLPTDLWVPSTATIRPQRSEQVAAGFARELGGYEVTLEGFYKQMHNLIEYKEGAVFLNIDSDWQTKVEAGNGESYGAEFFLQKKHGSLTGWLGYTLSWTNRQFPHINGGRVFPYKYDRRHDVGVALMKSFGKNIDMSLSWVYGTGVAVSLPTASYLTVHPSDNYFEKYHSGVAEYYEGRNGFRMRSYHRLDWSVAFKKEKKWGERTWTLGFYNVYNRKNPFFIDIGHDKRGNSKFIQYSLFPIIPSVSYSFKF